jgi:hypothetical protein
MPDEAAPGPSPPSRSLRIWYAVIQGVSFSVFVTLCFIARKFEAIFGQLEMRELPIPTEAMMATARFVRTPAGSVVMAALCVMLVVLGLRGAFDRILRKLIVGNVVGVFLLSGFYVQSLFLPLSKIQEALKDR